MNINQAKQLDLKHIVELFGGKLSHVRGHEAWFYSPFRPDEKTASFKVDEKKNSWHDFARTEGVDAHGDIIDLYTDYHNFPRRDSEGIKNALKYLGQFEPIPVHSKRIIEPVQKEPRFVFAKQPGKIWHPAMMEELNRRGIQLNTVQKYLKQAYVEDTETKKKYNGFAFENDEGGYEISIPNPNKQTCFKTCIGKKALSSSVVGQCKTALVFEGFWDMYTWVEMNPDKKQNLFVLNSVSLAGEFSDKILKSNQFDLVISYMNNDSAGDKATLRLGDDLESSDITFGTMNHIYEGYKDLNDYWTQNPNARNRRYEIDTAKTYYDSAWDHVRKSRLTP
jgi:hypothetical protein